MITRAPGLLAAAAGLMLLAACTSSTTGQGAGSAGAGSSTSSSVSTGTGSGGASTSPSSAGSSGSAPTTPPSTVPNAPAACANGQLTATVTDAEGATGHGSLILIFANAGASPCTVVGYPGLDASSNGGTVVHATRTLSGFAGGAKAIVNLTVAPAGTVSSVVEWLNAAANGGDCVFATTIMVTAPNTTQSQTLSANVSECSLQIHPLVAGPSGRD